jgi:hypothetical protein
VTPGIYEIDPQQYHADPCYVHGDPLTVSLSASGIRTLLAATPAHFAARNPVLTKWKEWQKGQKATKAQDRGTVIHSMLLGRGGEWIAKDCTEFSNKDGSPSQTWGSAEAKAWKAKQEARNVAVISRDEESEYLQIAEIARVALRQRFPWWDEGRSEQTLVWQRQTAYGPINCRALMDRLGPQPFIDLIDLKTTAKPIGDEDVQRKLALDGADIQAAFYLEGVRALGVAPQPPPAVAPEEPDDDGWAGEVAQPIDSRQFHFAHVETAPPYSVRIDTLSDNWLLRAQLRIDRACNLFAKCLYAGDWPSWPTRGNALTPPSWLESRWITAELLEEE